MVTALAAPSRRPAFVAEAQRRLEHQIPDEKKLGRSDFVIRNAGSLAELQEQVDALWPRLLACHAGARQDPGGAAAEGF